MHDAGAGVSGRRDDEAVGVAASAVVAVLAGVAGAAGMAGAVADETHDFR